MFDDDIKYCSNWRRNRLKEGFPGGVSGKELACQCRRCKRHGFDPWVGKISWRRAWQPTLVSLPGDSHGQRSLVGYSPGGRTEPDTTGVTWHARVHSGLRKKGLGLSGACRVSQFSRMAK